MTIMNAYYAHESEVGDVFDIATWSPFRSVHIGIVGLIAGAAMCLVTTFLYKPQIVVKHADVELLRELQQEVHKFEKTYPRGKLAATGIAGFLAWIFTGAGVALLIDAGGRFHIRCGPGGVSLRVPAGLDWRTAFFTSAILERDIPWDDVERLTVVQHKRAGALSRNAGNMYAYIELKLRDGESHTFSVDQFREAAYIIHDRIDEATRMTAWQGEEYQGRQLLAL